MKRLAAVAVGALAIVVLFPATASARTLSQGMCGSDVHHLQHEGSVHHAVEDIGEVRVTLQVADILDAAGGEIVHHLDAPSTLQEGLRQVRSDEAGSARDQCSRHADLRNASSWSACVRRTR